MNQPKHSDLYIINPLKLYYKIKIRNRIILFRKCKKQDTSYIKTGYQHISNVFMPEYGGHRHNLSNALIRLPINRCEFEEINAKCQMHRTLRELASPENSALYPNIQINDDSYTLDTSYKPFSIYLKTQFVII